MADESRKGFMSDTREHAPDRDLPMDGDSKAERTGTRVTLC